MSQRDECPYCFEALPGDVDACPACGESLGADPGGPPKSNTKLIVGIVVGAAALGFCCLIPVIAAIAVPNLVEARKRGNETAAIGALKFISTSQLLFREGDKDQDGVADYGTLDELAASGLIDAVLGSGTRNGYVFSVAPSPVDPEKRWMAVANPVVRGTTGDRSFVINQEGVVYSAEGQELTLNDECEIPEGLRPYGR
ncbi:MAG: hypothetical protein D6731_21520 [Planctomycetota bacterium]|nr:MAG: hypothetical protein D6731_21520 [Planctomycetota bacterium]